MRAIDHDKLMRYKQSIYKTVLSTIVACGVACGSQDNVASKLRVNGNVCQTGHSQEATAFVEFERTKGECPTCPMFVLSIFPDGRVVYRTNHDDAVPEKHESRMSDNDLKQLTKTIEGLGVFDLKDRYVEGKECPERWTDAPASKLSFRKGERTKTIAYYLGCKGSPELKKLERIQLSLEHIAEKFVK